MKRGNRGNRVEPVDLLLALQTAADLLPVLLVQLLVRPLRVTPRGNPNDQIADLEADGVAGAEGHEMVRLDHAHRDHRHSRENRVLQRVIRRRKPRIPVIPVIPVGSVGSVGSGPPLVKLNPRLRRTCFSVSTFPYSSPFRSPAASTTPRSRGLPAGRSHRRSPRDRPPRGVSRRVKVPRCRIPGAARGPASSPRFRCIDAITARRTNSTARSAPPRSLPPSDSPARTALLLETPPRRRCAETPAKTPLRSQTKAFPPLPARIAAPCTRDDARSASPAARSPPALAPRRGKPGKPRRGGANGARKCGEGRVFGGFASPCAA